MTNSNCFSVFTFLLVSSSQSLLFADAWAEKMVVTKKVDFGVIATGSEAKKVVKLTNVYDSTVEIESVTTTCGCSAATLGKKILQPGESASVEIKMNTHKFRQKKEPWLVIQFKRPRRVSTRVPIKAYIRTDVVFNPGAIRFGKVDFGKEGTAVVDIAYAGRPDWDIEHIKIANENLTATLSPPQTGPGTIKFKLTMTLSDKAKAGNLRDVVTLVTNDKSNPYVPLMVEGVVLPDIWVTPPTVNVRPLAVGQGTKFQVVVRGNKPFQIEDVAFASMTDSFKASLPTKASVLHQIPMEFSAPDRPGRFAEDVVVKVQGRSDPLRFTVTGTINN